MSRRHLSFLVLALFACVPAPPPRVEPPQPQFVAISTAQRVVLLSFDGLGADALAAQRDLPAFARMESEGATARVIPVNPTVTSTTHVSILTGAQSQVHGIIANRFHRPGTPPEQQTHGLDTEIDVETIVEAARRQGKRVGAVPFPTVDARSARRTTDFGFAWTTSLAPGRMVRLTRDDFRREWVPPTWTTRPQRRVSYSPIMRARIEWSVRNNAVRADVDLVAYDTTNDAATNYDAFVIETGEREIVPDSRGWFPISRQGAEGVYGSWSKLLHATGSLSDVTLYWGPISRTNAWPNSFQALLDNEIGFWPGVPEQNAKVDADTFIEQSTRLAQFVTHAQTLAIRRMPFELLLAYQSQVDTSAHNYLGRPDGERVLRAAFVNSDRAVAAISALLDPARDALIVTGDHGVAMIDTELRLGRWLSEQGFAPRWRAHATGNIANFYRFGGRDDADALFERLKSSGFFEHVERKTAASHRNSGDIVAYAWPRIALTLSNDAPAVASPASAGHHGALNTHRELHTVLYARGAGVPIGSLGEISQTRIARFVAQLLGISPPAAAE